MIEILETIRAVDIWNVFIGVACIILLIPVCTKAWKELLSALGLVSKKDIVDIKQNDDMSFIKNELSNFCGRLDKMDAHFNEIETHLGNVRKENDERRIKDIRGNILDFAAKIGQVDNTIEDYEQIFDINEEYHMLLKRHNMTNAKIDRAMAKVKLAYDKLISVEVGE